MDVGSPNLLAIAEHYYDQRYPTQHPRTSAALAQRRTTTAHVNRRSHPPTEHHRYSTFPQSQIMDLEMLRKEQRLLHLEREIEKRKRQIEDALRYHDELAFQNHVTTNYMPHNNVGQHLQHVAYRHLPVAFAPPQAPLQSHLIDDEAEYTCAEYFPHKIVDGHHYQQFTPQQAGLLPDEFVLPFHDIDATDTHDNGSHAVLSESAANEMLISENAHITSSAASKIPIGQQQGYAKQLESRLYSHHFATQSAAGAVLSQRQQQSQQYNMKNHVTNIHDLNSQVNKKTSSYLSKSVQTQQDKQAHQDVQLQQQQQQNPTNSLHNAVASQFAVDSLSRRDSMKSNEKTRKKYDFPVKRLLLTRDPRDKSARGNGVGMHIVGGTQCTDGHLGAFVKEIVAGGVADRLHGAIKEGDEVVEWNGISLMDCTYEDVTNILLNANDEIEVVVRQVLSPCPPDLLKNTNHTEHNQTKHVATMHSSADGIVHHNHLRLQQMQHEKFLRSAATLLDPSEKELGEYFEQVCHVQPGSRLNQVVHENWQRGQISSASIDSGSLPDSETALLQDNNCAGKSTMGERRRDQYHHVHHHPKHHPKQQQHLHKQPQQQQQQQDLDDANKKCSIMEDSKSQKHPRNTNGSSEKNMAAQNINASVVEKQRVNSDEDLIVKNDEFDNCQEAQADGDDKFFGEICLQMYFDNYDQSLTIHVAKARKLLPMDLNGLADPFVKLRLHPDPNEDPENNRQIKYMPNTLEPEWQQTLVFMNVPKKEVRKRVLECTVWDYDRLKANDFMGQMSIRLSSKVLDNKPHWFRLHEQRPVRSARSSSSNTDGTGRCKSKDKSKNGNLHYNEENHRGMTSTKVHHPSAQPNQKENDMIGKMVEDEFDDKSYSSSRTNMLIPSNGHEYKMSSNSASQMILSANEAKSHSQSLTNSRTIHFENGSIDSQRDNQLTRMITSDSRSSDSSSVVTDFLTEDQRDQVRRWLGPGQLLLMNHSIRPEKAETLPNENLVAAELYLMLRKVAEQESLQVTVRQARHIKNAPSQCEVYVKLYLLISKMTLCRVMKRKTKTQCVRDGAIFSETFVFNTCVDEMLLQVALWQGGKRLNMNKFLGEAVIHLDDIECIASTSKATVSGWYKLLLPDTFAS